MKNRTSGGLTMLSLVFFLSIPATGLTAESGPAFTGIQRLTNKEILLRLSGSTGVSYRIDAATNLPEWNGLLTLFSTGVNQHTDTAAPYLSSRYYRAEQLVGTNHVTGDHLVTTNGDVVLHPLFHATFVMTWNGKTIYNDPQNDATQFTNRYLGLPKADLILISHHHSDHYSAARIALLGGSNAPIIVPQKVYDQTTFAPFRTNAIVLNYGMSTNILGLTVLAVPGYNSNHLYTTNNAYIITIGGKRILTSGDTGDVPELRALTNIDVAFIAMNLPFAMSVDAAASMVRQFRPKVVYPYHYIPSTPAADLNRFKQLVGTDLGIEVRLRNWY